VSGIGWDDVALREFPALPAGFLAAADGIWEKILAWYWLAPPEREEWKSMAGDPARRRAWLAGRAALKDAVRAYLASRGKRTGAYDVVIRATAAGLPSVESASVSLAEAAGRTIAAAGDAARGAPGVEVRRAAEPVADDFDPEDLRRLRDLGEDWLARASCAKRAAARALGTGPVHEWRAMRLGEIQAAAGRIRLVPGGPWPTHPGAALGIDVHTSRDGEHVLALCRIGRRAEGS
jgi:hypothetical protein